MTIEQTATVSILDVQGTLARFGGDEQLFVEMTTFMLEDAPRHLSKLRVAIAAGETEAVESSAHALRGLLMNVGGVRAAHAAQMLEDAAHLRTMGDAPRLLKALDAEVDTLIKAIQDCPERKRLSAT